MRFIQDLKKTLYDVGENYTLREAPLAQKSRKSTGTMARKSTRPASSGGRISARRASG